MVGRARYDYRKDLALAAFYTNRSIGFTAGARAHWGAPIDATTYHHNLYAFYGFQALDGSFKDKRRPAFRTTGQLDSLGFRYDYTNVFSYDNPSHERNVRLYADWYDQALGSDFNYVDWGAHVALTQPLWSYRTIAAAQVVDGFSEPLGSSLVPNQGLYSLGRLALDPRHRSGGGARAQHLPGAERDPSGHLSGAGPEPARSAGAAPHATALLCR